MLSGPVAAREWGIPKKRNKDEEAAKISELRDFLKWTQAEAANRLGVTERSYRDWERGRAQAQLAAIQRMEIEAAFKRHGLEFSMPELESILAAAVRHRATDGRRRKRA